jgi:hypothetical protein
MSLAFGPTILSQRCVTRICSFSPSNPPCFHPQEARGVQREGFQIPFVEPPRLSPLEFGFGGSPIYSMSATCPAGFYPPDCDTVKAAFKYKPHVKLVAVTAVPPWSPHPVLPPQRHRLEHLPLPHRLSVEPLCLVLSTIALLTASRTFLYRTARLSMLKTRTVPLQSARKWTLRRARTRTLRLSSIGFVSGLLSPICLVLKPFLAHQRQRSSARQCPCSQEG